MKIEDFDFDRFNKKKRMAAKVASDNDVVIGLATVMTDTFDFVKSETTRDDAARARAARQPSIR